MTVEAAPLPAAETGNRPPRSVVKANKRREAEARKEILAPVHRTMTGAAVIVVLTSIGAVVPFILIVEACRELLAAHIDTGKVWRLLGAAVVVLVVRALLQAAALTWSHLSDARFQLAVRRSLAAKLTRVPLGWFERTSGEVKSYLQDDVEALHYLVAHARLDFVAAVTVPLVSLAYLLTVDWLLTLVLLIPLIVYAVLYSRMADADARDRTARYLRSERRTQEAVLEFVDGITVVRAFGRAGKAYTAFQDAVREQTTRLRQMKMPILTVQSVSDVVIAPVFVMFVVVVAGLAFVGIDWVDAVDLLPFILVGLGIGSSLLGLAYSSQSLRAAGAAALRLHELQQTPELSAGAGTPEPRGDEPAGTVRFEHVSFGYRADHEVLHDISFELTPGTVTALVGPSGSGKSTVAKLLPRFYDVDSGRITLGGIDIRDYSTEELYRSVGFVFQDVRLIRAGIRENLRLARPDADDAALERAARAARIHDRIAALPRGYDSEIGVDASLSGGEAQRLSIARALLADTPVLVLDEATAFADPESEAAVQDALATLVAGRTVLVIAHRLHTITNVDRILVLDDGALVEQGTHDSRRDAGGLYQRLWELNEAALGEVTLVGTEENR
ncbi:ABC transporter ATP-binding protein [Nocardia aurantia]|uniref:Iron import ATP-binding/permease protein IrtA n=1 Tax=Nocardia aurantia TaxID=2585199 RepID=A0A7K0DJF3_9NOCA|nr:ABC transporter ATP-binding protein [Nocardia aurantia]MQY24914.1 Iron import ATP-binding/permease protein IrtA [Nocardia aurantia]